MTELLNVQFNKIPTPWKVIGNSWEGWGLKVKILELLNWNFPGEGGAI